MSSDEMLSEDGPSGSQEGHPSMRANGDNPGVGANGVIWDPISKKYKLRTQDDQPDRFQVPGTPTVSEDFTMKTQNPQFEGVFAKTAAVRMVQMDDSDDWGVYSDRVNGPYDTPLVFRGTFDECRAWIRDEGRYASHVAAWSPEPANEVERFTNAAQSFWDEAEATTNPVLKRQYYQKADYYKRMAEMYRRDPAAEQADHAGPASTSESDVYNDNVPKRNPGMTDDSFPAMISHHIPKVISMLNTGRNSYTDPETPNLRDCPEGGCGGKMMDTGDESACHSCGHREKIHYAQEKDAGFLAPLVAPLAEGAIGEAAAGAAEGLGSSGVTNALRAGNLMSRVMGGGGSDAAGEVGGETPDAGAGSSVANDNMQSTGSSVSDEEGAYGNNQSGHDSEPDAGNKGSELQDHSADELDSDNDGDAGGSKAMRGEDIFLAFEPYLESIADNPDSHNDPIAKAVHEALLKDDPDYLSKAARYEISKTAGGTCPTCHIDLTSANECGGPTNVTCPVGLPHGGQGSIMPAGQNPGGMGQPLAKTADYFNDQMQQWEQMARSVDPAAIDAMRDWLIDYDAANPENKWGGTRWNTASMSPDGMVLMAMDDFFPGGYKDFADGYNEQRMQQEPMSENEQDRGMDEWTSKIRTAARPKMCPAHEHLVNYALTLQDPAAALGAFAGQLFGEHSCQGGYELLNSAGNAVKCKYKPEMITQAYWDEKDAQREQRKLEREQQQALLTEQVQEQPVVQELEPEGQLVGGPALDEQLEAEEKLPITQDIPSTSAEPTDVDYIAPEQGAQVIQFPQAQPQHFDGFQQAASYKWSGPGMLTPELAPSESPEEMFSDSPPEELPTDTGDGGDLTDTQGNPVEVGMTYEVQSPRADDTIPDKYTITGKDSNLVSFTVGDDDAPIKFDDNLSVAQIKAEGLTFTPVAGDPNSFGDVEPSGNSDNTGEGDAPGTVTDLDTGGNSHASKVAGPDDAPVGAWDNPSDFGTHQPIFEMLDRLAPEEREAVLEYLNKTDDGLGFEEDNFGPVRYEGEHPPGYSDSDYDDGGEGDEPYPRTASNGNPDLDWLNDGSFDKTAGRDFSIGEQRNFVNEQGAARNLDKLDLSGTHYPVAGSDDPYSDFLW